MRIYLNIPGTGHLWRIVGGEKGWGKEALVSTESPSTLCNDKKNFKLNSTDPSDPLSYEFVLFKKASELISTLLRQWDLGVSGPEAREVLFPIGHQRQQQDVSRWEEGQRLVRVTTLSAGDTQGLQWDHLALNLLTRPLKKYSPKQSNIRSAVLTLTAACPQREPVSRRSGWNPAGSPLQVSECGSPGGPGCLAWPSAATAV